MAEKPMDDLGYARAATLKPIEEIADAVARWAADDVVLVAGGRVKHMTLAQNDVLARSFGSVQAQRAQRKSRLILAEDAHEAPESPPFPVYETHAAYGVTIAAHGGAFAGARIDIGTRVLLDVLDRVPPGDVVVDLGCGSIRPGDHGGQRPR